MVLVVSGQPPPLLGQAAHRGDDSHGSITHEAAGAITRLRIPRTIGAAPAIAACRPVLVRPVRPLREPFEEMP